MGTALSTQRGLAHDLAVLACFRPPSPWTLLLASLLSLSLNNFKTNTNRSLNLDVPKGLPPVRTGQGAASEPLLTGLSTGEYL